ncbi:MAG TPA: DUF1080 domain-containing protein [Candidatus Angelobacter sp.]|nr:DUF1080 domain-containing protein [Candidatus Angelobacter sp.]
MKKSPLATLLFLGALAGCSTTGGGQLKSLFNGRDLTGWVAMYGGEWAVEDGLLVGRNGRDWSTNPEKSGSWLRTTKQYGDFVLELDYAINDGGNSGIFIRSALEKNPAFTGHEMQILADHGRQPTKGSAGSLYDVVPARKNMSKPAGEWNHVRIETHGRRIQISWNGEQTIDYETDRLTRGYIGLQNHDTTSVVKFRNIRIQEL